MGITVRSKNYSIDLGYTGFLRLRTKVAELTAPDIFLHYRRLLDGRSLLHEADRKKFYEEYDKKTEELDRKHNGEMSDILDYFIDGMTVFYIHLTGTICLIVIGPHSIYPVD